MNGRYKNYEIEVSSTEGSDGRWQATGKVTPSISGRLGMKGFQLFVGGFNTQVGAEVEALLMITQRIDQEIGPDDNSHKF